MAGRKFFSFLNRIALSPRGSSLTSIMIGVGLTGLATVFVLQTLKTAVQSDAQSKIYANVDHQRNKLYELILRDPVAWDITKNHPNNNTFSCLQLGSHCCGVILG